MRTFLIATVIMLVAALATSAHAQPDKITVQANLGSQLVYVGDSVELTIQVQGSSNPERPKVSVPQGVQGEFLGGADQSSHFVSIVNGNRTNRSTLTYTFQYRLTPTRAGEYQIPPVEVVVDGKTYRTQPVSFSATPAPQNNATRLSLGVDKASLYVGEPTTLRVVWLIAADVRALRFSDLNGADAFDFSDPRNRIPTGRQSQDPSVREFVLFGKNVVATLDQETVNGQQYTRITMEQVITPKEPGTHELGPISVALDLITGGRPQTLFDSVFENRGNTKRVVATSDPVTIEVKPLPTQGRPADFSGLVGSYTLKSIAEPTDVGIGDPITLRLTLDGPDPLDRATAPSLEDIPGFADSFKLSPEGWSASTAPGGARQFTTTVRVTNASVSAIPPIAISSFDTASGRYTSTHSAPIALKVRATRTITAADAIVSPNSAPVASSGTLESAAPGLPANFESLDVLADEGAPLTDRLHSPVVVTLLALPAAAYLAVAGTLAVRRVRHPSRPRLSKALRTARRHLARASTPPAIAEAIRHYVADVTKHEATTLTGDDCAALLERSGVANSDKIGTLITTCDARRFGGPEADADSLRRQALDLLTPLDRDLRRAS